MSARTVNESLIRPVAWVTYPNGRSIKVRNLGWLCRHIADVVRIEINWSKIALLTGCQCILYATTIKGTVFSCGFSSSNIAHHFVRDRRSFFKMAYHVRKEEECKTIYEVRKDKYKELI